MKPTRAYKFLRAGGIGPFSGFAWPRPDGDAPGPWVEAVPFRGACGAGIHGCDTDHLVYWLDHELWAIELDDAVVANKKLIAPRGRLLHRVDGWNDATARRFVAACIARATARVDALPDGDDATLARGYLADARVYGAVDTGAGIFCAAHTALTVEAFAEERRWQSRWLAADLGLP